jgi:amino-acid N-acetyltransferase
MTDQNGHFNVHWLRHASPFINQHRDRTFVVLLSGEVLDHPNAKSMLHDLVLLHSLGVRLVLVHGSRPQIDAILQREGIESTFQDGYRITSEHAMSFVAQAAGEKRMGIEAKLSTDMEASPMRGAKVRVISGNFIIARPRGVVNGTDFAYSGEVRKVDTAGIRHALDNRNMVLISHIGYSRTGEMFNLACESVACEVATALQADKLIVFSQGHGLIRDNELVRYTTPHDCTGQGTTALNDHEMRRLSSAARATTKGVERAHMVSYTEDGALLKELFTRDGSGTLITDQELETLRVARDKDAGRLLHILRPLEQDGTLVKRSRKRLEQELSRFIVIEKESLLIGCAALYPIPNSSAGELACLVIRDTYRSGGRGDRLLREIEASALAQNLDTLFVLTTKTAHWFLERGFEPASVDNLPQSRQTPYNLQRNSKVFRKHLKR